MHTTEHVLRIGASGIDNAVLELEGPEVPILDGSALPFMSQIEEVGSTEQDADRRFFKSARTSATAEKRASRC